MKFGFITAGLILSCFFFVPNVPASGGGHGGGGGGGGGGSSGGGHSSSGGGSRASAARGNMSRSMVARGYRGMPPSARYSVYGYQPIRPSGAVSHHAVSHTGSNRANRSSGANRAGGRRNDPTIGETGNRIGRNALTNRAGTANRRTWARDNPANKSQFDAATQQKLRNSTGPRSDIVQARQRNGENRRNRHGCDWWRRHCGTIILVDFGFWGWWDGWWYPTWGYDPYYSSYPYDGPIYGYDGLPPDEAVANVQRELQRRGYYSYAADGVLGPLTQNALNRYQRDHRLPITGTIDPATANSLGLSD